MNLKLIRLRARTMQVQQPGLAILFALPVLLTILANFLLSGQDLVNLLPDMTLQQASIYMIQRQLFPSVVSFVISILVVGATFSYLDTINPKIKHRTRVLDIFKQDRFTPVFMTLFLKQVILFVWGILLYAGGLVSTYASIRFLAIYDKVSDPSSLSTTSPQFQAMMQQVPLMTIGIALGLLGLLFYLPQYYSFSLVELILYEQLRDGDFKGAFGIGPKPSNHERLPQQSLGARSHFDRLALPELLHARCHRFLHHAILYQLPNCILRSNQTDQTRATPFYCLS